MQLGAYLPKGSYRLYKLHQLVPVRIFSFNGRCEIFILGQDLIDVLRHRFSFFPQNLGKLYLLWMIEIKENELIMAMQSLLSFLSKFHGESQQKSVEKYMHIVATKNIKVCANCDF